MAHTKEYVKLKIEQCQGLVDNAISEDQAKVYQGYLDFWSEKLPKKEQPEILAKKAEEKQKRAEEKAEFDAELKREKDRRAEKRAIGAEKLRVLEALKAKKLLELAALNAELEPEEPNFFTITGTDPEELNEINFEKQFPNKKAYRTQNGERIETIAFKEYLTKKDSE